MTDDHSPWPEQALAEWSDTCETLHRWTQIVGKVRMALTPLVNSLVERHALRDLARAHHLADRVRHAHLRRHLRLHRATIQAALRKKNRPGVRVIAAPGVSVNTVQRIAHAQ
jgi:Family of unknown function (DUF5996)